MMHRRLILAWRIMKTGFINFFRNLWLSTAAAAIMLVTLLILSSTIIVNRALDDTIDDLAQEITVSVFLQNDAPDEKIQELESSIRDLENVRSVSFISQDEARRRYIERNEADQALLEALTIVDPGSTFPQSFEVELHDLSRNQELVALFNQERFSDTVEDYDEDRLSTAAAFGDAQRFLSTTGIIAGLIFAGISMLVIFNTIRMAIFTRRNEIQIMQLVGASNSYIRGPFLFESMMYGVISGILCSAIVFPLLSRIQPVLENNKIIFQPIVDYASENVIGLSLIIILFGALIGVMSSMLALTRYLRLK